MKGASRKSEQVLLSEGTLKAFKALKKACMTAAILAFANYTKPFLLETNVSKDGLGVVLSQKQMDGQYLPVAYGSRALMPHKKYYHSTKLEFLALKWPVTEHFKEYLPHQSFLVKTYIMMTPNLDVTGHQWGWSPCQGQFPVGVPKRMAQHCGRCTEPGYYLP